MHPYKALPSKHFWAPAVGNRHMLEISDLWDPKFSIDGNAKVATYGSCFAQHIGRGLRARGFNWLISETAPASIGEALAAEFNYGVFSARTGNIYTASLLRQWLDWSMNPSDFPDEIWQAGSRYFDPFRPNIEPGGFSTAEEVHVSRRFTAGRFKASLQDCDILVFTLGLTESWFNSQRGYEYPMCPGTIAGEFDSTRHAFLNQDYAFIHQKLSEVIETILKDVNPRIKFLLTVSPVPLTATMSGRHVLVATTESKAILRAVAGSLARKYAVVDYFPSYEIITSAPFRGTFFDPNLRTVNRHGVAHVMSQFFNSLQQKDPDTYGGAAVASSVNEIRSDGSLSGARRKPAAARQTRPSEPTYTDVACEEELLRAFEPGRDVTSTRV